MEFIWIRVLETRNSKSRTWYLLGICKVLILDQNIQRQHITRQNKPAISGFSQSHQRHHRGICLFPDCGCDVTSYFKLFPPGLSCSDGLYQNQP